MAVKDKLMKMTARNITLTSNLELTERETKMLGWLAGFGGAHIAKAIATQLTSEFKVEEWDALWSQFCTELESADKHFANVRGVFNGTKQVKL